MDNVRLRPPILVALLTVAIACGDDEGANADGAVDSTAAPVDASGLALIDWSPCSYYAPANRWDDQRSGSAATDLDGNPLTAECANVAVPLDWDDPTGETITVFVKHWGTPCDRGTGSGCGRAMWLLHGGPGGAGVASAAYFFQVDNPTLDVYAVDQRGTGRSTYLTCDAEEAAGSAEGRKISAGEWLACRESLQATWSTRLDHFTTTNMAYDLGNLIEWTRAPGQEVFTWGASYGTYWTQRYLQAFPNQATGSILHGVASAGPAGPDGMNFATYMHQYEDVGAKLEALCAADPVCSSYVGSDATAVAGFVDDVLANLDAPGGYCDAVAGARPDRYNRIMLRKWFASMLLVSQSGTRALPFAVLHRFKRCNETDVKALLAFAGEIYDFSANSAASTMFSQVQNMHISLSEMWAEPISREDAVSYADACSWCFGRTERWDNDPTWPRYAHDALVDGYADTQSAVLMMCGELDPASIIDKALIAADNLTSPHKYFFTLPGTSHTIPSVLAARDDGAIYDCARALVVAFMDDPTSPPPDCTADILGVDLGWNEPLAHRFESSSCGPSSDGPCVHDIWRNYVY